MDERKKPKKPTEEEARRNRSSARNIQQKDGELGAVFEALSDIVIVFDSHGVISRANQAATAAFGFDPTNSDTASFTMKIDIRRPGGQKVNPDELPIFKALQGNRVKGEKYVFTDARGSEIIVLISANPFFADGKVSGAVSIWHDITDQELAKFLSDALNIINLTINSTLDFDEIMQRVVIESAKALRAEVAGISMREDSFWVLRYSYGYKKDMTGRQCSEKGLRATTLAAKIKKPVGIDDAFNDKRANREVMRQHGIKSLLVVPLVVRGSVAGAINFSYRTSHIAFKDAHYDFAGKLSTSISLALENSRLYAVERNIADTLQETLLTVPDRIEGLDFGHLYCSASEAARVGGDFYDLFEIEHNKIGVVIGDVSGKGLGASTLTMLVKNTVRAYAYENNSPAKIISRANDVVIKTATSSLFVTVFLGVINTRTGDLTYCNAGHPVGIIKRASTKVDLIGIVSPMIGAFQGLKYIDGKTNLGKGDELVLYTDGVTEARRDNQLFGEQRLIELAERLRSVPAQDMPRLIFNDIMRFTGGRLSDDLAIVALSLQN